MSNIDEVLTMQNKAIRSLEEIRIQRTSLDFFFDRTNIWELRCWELWNYCLHFTARNGRRQGIRVD